MYSSYCTQKKTDKNDLIRFSIDDIMPIYFFLYLSPYPYLHSRI
jgi:hypothetical protein